LQCPEPGHNDQARAGKRSAALPVLELWKGTTEVVGRCLAAFADKARTRSRGASPTEASGREPLGEHLGVEGEHDVIARPVSDDQLGDLR
jgi:hypothetical protein